MSEPTQAAKAYGLLWRSISEDPFVHEARRLLLGDLDTEDRKEGIRWAVETYGSMTDSELIAADIRNGLFPEKSYG